MIKLVITGCRGFIGSNFLEHYLKSFEENSKVISGVVLIDAGFLKGLGDMPEWNMDVNLELYNNFKDQCLKNGKTFEEYNGDINHMPINKDDGDTKYVVLNFASESHVDNSITDPFSVYTANSTLVPNLITWMGIDNINEFIHIRTDEEYGHLLSKDDDAFALGDPIKPRNPYSASKASQTLFLQSLHTTFGLDVKFITLANQYGKWQHPSKMIPATIKRLVDGDAALIYGYGTQLREWTYIDDTCSQIIDHMLNGSGDIHISNTEGLVTNLELVKALVKLVDDHYGITGTWQFVDDRKGHDFCYKLQPTTTFKYTPLEAGLKETVKHYIELYER